MASSVGQTLISLIEAEGLTAFGAPLLTFLAAVQAAGGDPIKITAAWVQLQGDVVGHAPSALGGLEGALAAVIASKLQSVIAAHPVATPAAA